VEFANPTLARTGSQSDFVAKGSDDVDGDFILLADLGFADRFERVLCPG